MFVNLFSIPFIFMGAWLIHEGYQTYCQAKESPSWQTTRGVVQRSFVDRREEGFMETDISYHAMVTYRYQVDGREFTGERIYLGDSVYLRPEKPGKLVATYPKGAAVTVYYKRENPKESLLVPGVNDRLVWMPLGGLISLLCGGTMLINNLRKRPETEAAAYDNGFPDPARSTRETPGSPQPGGMPPETASATAPAAVANSKAFHYKALVCIFLGSAITWCFWSKGGYAMLFVAAYYYQFFIQKK
jgi:hypothetical protein